MRISDWSSDVCSSDLTEIAVILAQRNVSLADQPMAIIDQLAKLEKILPTQTVRSEEQIAYQHFSTPMNLAWLVSHRSEEHTSELQSLMRISYAVFCLKKKKEKIVNSIHSVSMNKYTCAHKT